MTELAFSVHHRGRRVDLDVDGRRIRVAVHSGPTEPVQLVFRGRTVVLESGQSAELALDS